MISKVNAACKSLAAGTRKNVSESSTKQQVQSATNKRPKPSTSNEVLVINNRGNTIEFVVTTKGRKSESTMVSTRQAPSSASKVSEDSHTNNWSKTLREQSRPVMQQGIQQLAAHKQSSKHSRYGHSERKERKETMVEIDKPRKHMPQDNRMLDEIPVKLSSKKHLEQPKSALNSAVPSTTTIASSVEVIEVTNRGVQCGGIFDRSNDKFSAFNPVRTIGFLMKEMEGLMKDERSSNILTEMEQALLRIPMDSEKTASVLEATTAKLAEYSAKIEATCAAHREEIESLTQEVQRQAVMLEEAKQRERNLEGEVKQLKIELNDALKSGVESKRLIVQLQQENKSIEVMEKLATDLRRELNDQIELAEQRFMEGQYLQLEKEKLMTLSSYKDSKLVELRTSLKELQNHISEQLNDIREAGKRVKDPVKSHQPSLVQVGPACSSPTSSCSLNSIVPGSCPELSKMSLSTIDCFTSSGPAAHCLNGSLDESEVGRPCDKTQLEFISLPGGEISHAISLTQRKEEEASGLAASQNKIVDLPSTDRKVEAFHSVPNLGGRNPRDSLHRVERESKASRGETKARKSSSSGKKRSGDAKCPPSRVDGRRTSVERASGDPASIKEQFEMIFEDIRQQSKLPMHVPSPPRNYPRPDWSDSSLPTISGILETNVV